MIRVLRSPWLAVGPCSLSTLVTLRTVRLPKGTPLLQPCRFAALHADRGQLGQLGPNGQSWSPLHCGLAFVTAAAVAYGHQRRSCTCVAATSSDAGESVTEYLPGALISTERFFTVPLDHSSESNSPTLTVFARELVLEKHKGKDLPVLLYLQGGPGFPAARPSSASGGWLGRALQDYRVLLLDQRGTGRSTPVTAQTLQGMESSEAAEYLSHFRADSIVEDCEVIRKSMGVKKLTLLGQSFGGFCALTYLSKAPESLREVFLTGGLAPVFHGPDEVYKHLYKRVLERNRLYYMRYPADVKRVRRIVQHLDTASVTLPGGGRLTPRRFLSLGLELGSGSGMEHLHWLVESAFVENHKGDCVLDYRFLCNVEAMQRFDTNPIYWLLHEAIYCSPTTGASQWAAHRVLNEDFKDSFDYRRALEASDSEPLMFTGEMVYPWFAKDFATLGGLSECAEMLACRSDWPALYITEVLRNTSVPVAAAMYYDDMYVERAFSEEVVHLLGQKCKVWVTNEFQHSGIRDDGARVLDTLIKMLRGEVSIPS